MSRSSPPRTPAAVQSSVTAPGPNDLPLLSPIRLVHASGASQVATRGTPFTLDPDHTLPPSPFSTVARLRPEFKLALAIISVADDLREASWYGPWHIAIDYLFAPADTLFAMTITHPQYSLVRLYDVDASESSSDEDDHGGDTSGQPSQRRIAAVTPPRKALKRKRLDPAPPQTPEKKLTHIQKRSMRIPDYVERLHNLVMRPDGSGPEDPPRIYRSRNVLLAEVKPHVPMGRNVVVVFLAAREQAMEQARHAFAGDQDLKEIGVLLCVGRKWSYTEFSKDDLPATPEAFDDAAYTDTTTSEEDKAELPIPPLQAAFGGAMWLDLQDSEGRTERAFVLIRERIQHMHRDMWFQ
ncbi:hypothetical protein FA95DRAFT_1030401 [Auriscalpium vulgare]|uniref:Uncharacterized protein n=1 Tax=Auriscalpium vulgare TaxID=40419 RepID=A0ACB8R6Z8_9AGAM|nr:hypothetical protein FA95DRAFT_1030401 [Auriscalpium vulgare]